MELQPQVKLWLLIKKLAFKKTSECISLKEIWGLPPRPTYKLLATLALFLGPPFSICLYPPLKFENFPISSIEQ